MRKLLLLLALMLLPTVAKGQGYLYTGIALNQNGRPIPNPTITVCTSVGTGVPCTPLVPTIYSDAALTQVVSNPLPNCTTIFQSGCSDAVGNFSFYIAPGEYTYTISGSGTTLSGPYKISIPCVINNGIDSCGGTGTFAYVPDSAFASHSTPTFQMGGTSGNKSTVFDFVLNQNVGPITFSVSNPPPANTTIFAQLNLCENGTGGWTLPNGSWPANVILPTGFTFSPTTAGTCFHLMFRYNPNNNQWTPVIDPGSGGGGSVVPAGTDGDFQCKSGSNLAACHVNDNGTTITASEPVTINAVHTQNANSVFKGPNPYFDIMTYGGYIQPTGTPNTASCSISATSTTLSCSSNPDFANGHGVVIPGAGQLPLTRNASFPAAPTGTVTPLGVSNGSTTYNYKYVLEDYFGGLTAAGTQFSTTTGAATLGTNTVSLTGVVRSGGIDTFTCSGNCNIAVGSQVQISGFTALNVKGTVVTASNPTASTFTVNAQGLPDYTESASATASVRACNALIPSGTLTQESVILRTWIYRGGTLVGVSPGQDPFFIDCNQGVTAPSYVPNSAPGAAQAGYLATTISSGGGTNTMTLAASAGTTVSSVTVQHDNSAALIAAWTAAYAAHGGVVRIPIIPGNTLASFPFNALTNLNTISNPTAATVKLQVSVVNLSQPWIMTGFSEFEGIPQTSTSFQYSPLGSIGGAAIPLFLANANSGSGVVMSKIKFSPTSTGASSIVLDETLSPGGEVGYQFIDIGANGLNAPAVIIKGGFDFWFTRGTYSVGGSETSQWFAHPAIESTNASPYLNATSTQLSGRIKIYDTIFAGGTAFQQDNFPALGQAPGFTGGSINLIMSGVLHESNAGPTIRLAVGGSGSGGLDISDISMADQTNGTHQPALEMTGTTNSSGITLRNNKGGGNPLIAGGGSVATPTCINNFNLFGCGQTSNYNLTGSITTVDGGQIGATNGGSIGYFMGTPAVPTSCVVSAGGSAPIGSLTYTIVATDRNPIAFSPILLGMTLPSPSCSATTSGGNQTVTITRPTLPSGATGWVVFRGGVEAFIAGVTGTCVTPIAATVTTYVDSVASICGASTPSINTAFSAGINSSGANAVHFSGGGLSLGSRTLTSGTTLTTSDGIVYGNTNSGSFAITLPHAAAGEYWIIYNVSTGANTLTVQPDSGLLDGGASTTILNGNAKAFTCDLTNCQTVATTGTGGGGSGTINAAAQYSDPYYSAAGTSSTLSGLAPQTTNGIYFRVHNVSSSVAVPPSDSLLGIAVNAQSSNYTLAYTDRAGYVLFSSCSTPTLTLPAIAGNVAANMPFRVFNGCSGNLTITPTTQTIAADGGSQVASITLLPNWWALITQDSTPNWFAIRMPALSAFNSSCTAITMSATSGLICATLPTVSGVNSQTVTYTAVAGDNGKIVAMNGSSITLNLPASPPAAPWGIFVENLNASSLTVNRNGLNIDGAASNLTLTQNQGVWISHDGSNYFTSRGVGGAGGGGGGTPCTATSNSLQYNNGGAFGCTTEFTYASSKITASSSGLVDMSATVPTTNKPISVAANAAPVTLGTVAIDSTKGELVYGNGVTTLPAGVFGPADYYQSEEWLPASCTAGNLGGWALGVGSCANVTTTTGHYGVISVSTGGTINTITRFGYRGPTGNGDVYPALNASTWLQKWVVRLAEAGCAGEACTINVKYRLGMMNAWGTDPPGSGWYFEAVEGATNNSNIKCVTNNAGTSTSTDSGIALDTNFHTFTIFNDSGGASAKFYIDGALVCTNTTNIPTASPVFPDFQSVNTSANAKLSDFDYWSTYIATPRTN